MMSSIEVAPFGGVSCGARLKQAREAAGLSVEEVSARLKMPGRVVQTLESDDWSTLGAPVFVRGQVRSYARLLNVDVDAWLEQTAPEVAPSVLVSHSHTPRFQRVFEHVTRRAIYIVMTAAIAVPVWLATRPHLNNNVAVQSLEVPDTPAPAADPAPAPQTQQRTPVVASMAPMPTQAAQTALSLNFTGESWFQVDRARRQHDRDGNAGSGPAAQLRSGRGWQDRARQFHRCAGAAGRQAGRSDTVQPSECGALYAIL